MTAPQRLGRWSMQVHEHCMRTGRPITPQEAIALFGDPPSRSSASATLYSAAEAGWFLRIPPARPDEVVKYRAVEKVEKHAAADERASWFDGLKRVRSVFELGGTP